MDSARQKRLEEVDWDDLIPRLRLQSSWYHRKISSIRGAPTLDDLVHEAITSLLEGRRSLPEGVSVLVTLIGIVRSLTSNFVVKHRSVEIPEGMEAKDPSNGPGRIEFEASRDYWIGLMKDETKLSQRIVQIWLNDPECKPRTLAVMLGVGVQDIYAELRRLRRRLDRGSIEDDL